MQSRIGILELWCQEIWVILTLISNGNETTIFFKVTSKTIQNNLLEYITSVVSGQTL